MKAKVNFEHAKGGSVDPFPGGPPLLDPSKARQGHAFLGLNLTRNHSPGEKMANCDRVTRQTQFDFNQIQDREYEYLYATNDDGWLCGGGENGDSTKLTNIDSAHVEIVNMGSFNEEWGGASRDRIREVMSQIMIPHIAITPSLVLRNPDTPPELELKFELERDVGKGVETWPNWQLRFVHNQVFDRLTNPARFCPGPHHMSFTRKAAFRSPKHMQQYFEKCDGVVRKWRERGATLIEPETDPSKPGYPSKPLGSELDSPHGVYLFKNRNEPIEYFEPNFHPPYDTPEKRKIISDVLSKEWDEDNLTWRELDESDTSQIKGFQETLMLIVDKTCC